MIRLNKLPMPEVLVQNAVAWTNAIVQKLANNEALTPAEKTRYRHPGIKEALVQETNGKCAYCESKVQHIHHGDVEHVYPKSLAPEKTVEWDNLTLACEICNQNKSNLDPLVEHILDPYSTEPEDHLIFVGALIFPRGTPQGQSTRQILDLNRGALVERRQEAVDRLMGIYDTLLRADLPAIARQAIYEDLKARNAGNGAQYAAMARALIEQMRPHLPAEVEAAA